MLWKNHQMRMERWVVSEILRRPDLVERKKVLKKMIDIMLVPN
jgi:hypothetical protein